MPWEIERKFLVPGPRVPAGRVRMRIVQGYFAMRGGFGRVRVQGAKGFVTIKGPPRGIVREELEYPVPVALARLLLDRLCGEGRVEKDRVLVRYRGHAWEVDVFRGRNRGLVLAEIELRRPDEPFDRPPWAGAEVSLDPRFLNAQLARRPWRTWSEGERAAALRGG